MIRLHRKHGLAPTIPTCFFCLKQKSEVAFLGAGWRGNDAPPMTMVVDYEPCDECKDFMRRGIILVSIRDPHRIHYCECGYSWRSQVKFSKAGQITNVSQEPTPFCPKCGKGAMRSSEVVFEDKKNPYRTGAWCVVKDDALQRMFPPESPVFKYRFAFVEDSVWDLMGLPRTDIPDREAASVPGGSNGGK